MANKIQIRRGLKANLPSLDVGEPALCTDTKEVFVGNSNGNVALINKETLDEHLKDYTLQIPFAVTTGSANTYAATLSPAPTNYIEGMAVAVKINVTNSGASTINISNLGAKSIRDPRGNTLPAGKLTAGSIYTLRYNGANFILQGEGASGNATASDLLSGKTASTDAGEINGTMPNRIGHVTAQGGTVSGTTLRLRPQPGYYSGATGNSVQLSDANFLAENIRQGVTLFGITGTLVPGPDDHWGTPGPGYLAAGSMNEGYFGFVSAGQLISGASLAQAIGLSAGTSQFSDAGWLKWVKNNKIMFVAKKTLRHSIAWDQIDAVGAVFGDKTVVIGGFTYKVRLLTGGKHPGGGEWNVLMYGVHKDQSPNWDSFNDTDLHVGTGNGHRSWCQEVQGGLYTLRGGEGITGFIGSTPENKTSINGWRPCLELVG
ncbi:MAG: hypothetical protein WAO57_08810 [Syntrophomonadaceae bacterium]|jgi:hypothetical protein|nr:hypothetical protein [Mycobacteriales bacterium]